MRSRAQLVAALLLPAMSAAAPPGQTTGEQTITAAFVCDGGKKIQAVFATGSQPSVKLTLADGRQISLPQVLSASGARYANRDESIVFWNKGRTAFVEEGGQRTYQNCAPTR